MASFTGLDGKQSIVDNTRGFDCSPISLQPLVTLPMVPVTKEGNTMAKTAFEKAIEKQTKEAQKAAREAKSVKGPLPL